jgi:5-methylcytosine-specific restriction endonuclease McrA
MKDNPEWLTRGTENRRLRKSLVYSEPYTTQDVLDKWGTICYLCNKEIDITNRKSFNNRSEGRDQSLSLDHVIPLAYGGPDTLDNVKPTHNVCNNKKGYKIPEELVTEELLQAKVLIDKLIGVKKVGRPLKD